MYVTKPNREEKKILSLISIQSCLEKAKRRRSEQKNYWEKGKEITTFFVVL